MVIDVKRGDICYFDLAGNVGSEQGGVRPCLVIQNDVGNRFAPTTIVYPITKRQRKFVATHVAIDCLREPSVVLCEQPRTVDQSRFKQYICSVSAECMDEVEEKALVAIGIIRRGGK